MEEIPQIKPESNSTAAANEGTPDKEEGAILIPKLGGSHRSNEKPDKESSESKSKRKFNIKFRMTRKVKITLLVFGIFAGLAVLFVAVLSLLGYRVYKDAMIVKANIEKLVEAGTQQNLLAVEQELARTKTSVDSLANSYSKLKWLGAFPYVGRYVQDGQHGLGAAQHGLNAADVVVLAIEPYADIIGFAGDTSENATDGAETAQDRLDFVVNTIPDLIPKADELSREMSLVRSELSHIDPERYPEEFKGMIVRERLKTGLELVDMASQLITNGKPLLEVAPELLGTEEPRTYLVLFQNDKELRPTGGFLTAYSIATVEAGKFEPVSSNDIYNLEENYTPTIPAPEPIRKYLKGPYEISPNFRLRDTNWSPDFKQSMDLFAEEAEKVGIDNIDGIIAVDTQLLVNLLDAIGPIGVPGFGNFSTEIDDRCNCPNVIYELESFADVEGAIVWDQLDPTKIIYAPPNYENRKRIIGPLMNSVLSNALGQSKEKIPALFEAGFKSLTEKHVLFYLFDEEEQKAAETFGIAGTISDFEGDYLHVNDANLGGRKSNLYVTQQVEQDIEISREGTVTKTVTLTYNNPEKHDGWLNSVLPNWVRIYVPEGSTLIDLQGLEEREEPYDELGKTVFSGFFELRPQGVAKIVVTYELPFKVTGEGYEMLIQKQPGTDAPLNVVRLDKETEEFFLRSDKELKFQI